MSEREYFSYRYAIPGYTVILLVVAINYVPLLEILNSPQGGDFFGAFLAFLSLFTGSAVGFLISQFWWLRFLRKPQGGVFKIGGFELLKSFLIEECMNYGLIQEKKEQAPMEAILDYIRHRETKEEISKYAERRWDMYHVLSSTFYSLATGFGVGWAFRGYYQFSIFACAPVTFSAEFLAELFAQLFILFCVVALLLTIYYGRKRLMTNYYPTLKAFIRHELGEMGKELPKVFPDFFEK